MQPDRNAEVPQRLDGLIERDAPPLDLEPTLAQERRDIGPADRPEQTPLVGSLPGLAEMQSFGDLGLALRIRLELVGPALLAGLDAFKVLHVRRRRMKRQLLRQQIV